ncbi:esterase/lipase [Actinomadura pelletieri DSM 43383]|uniref:Esterase/lipase n=1 Tax=Actinomadura pelletieri DSM 43383 TaxID=1120940 RepID=A0A495Q9L7_9ACTN|nr:alpha/beta hydrolase [Actinomadura pelletieri]RKS68188.1 esterase/lipase [Actinomadura pelletieri DSM 43383]
MNDVGELKRYVEVHARGQRIPRYRALLGRITTDEGDGPGTWTGEWCRAAELLAGRGRDLEASRYFAMARFPYVDGPPRQKAQDRAVESIRQWAAERGGLESVEVEMDGGRVRCWATGLSASSPKPLLVIMGGIVTVKEQWAPTLVKLRRLGMAGLVTELPGVGENTLRYGPDSRRMLSRVLDAVSGRADVSQTYAIALSFSGHLALHCAAEDDRIKGIITAGAPVHTFFTDPDWRRALPRITVDTLAHLTGEPAARIEDDLGAWALSGEQLAGLRIPVFTTASLRDEIIPAGDVRFLREHVRDLEVVEYDDVHGAPLHVGETQLWSIASLLRARGVRTPQSAVIGLLLRGHRARRRLSRPARARAAHA